MDAGDTGADSVGGLRRRDLQRARCEEDAARGFDLGDGGWRGGIWIPRARHRETEWGEEALALQRPLWTADIRAVVVCGVRRAGIPREPAAERRLSGAPQTARLLSRIQHLEPAR